MDPITSLGRRKTSVARVILSEGDGSIFVNGVEGAEYFPILTQQFKLKQPFKLTGTEGKYDVSINVDGGGITGQVEAARLGIARARLQAIYGDKASLDVAGAGDEVTITLRLPVEPPPATS